VFFNTNNPWPQAATYQGGIVVQAVAAGNSVTEGTGVDFLDDLNLAFGKVEADGYDVDTVYARRKVRAHLRGLRATTREPIVAANIQAGEEIAPFGVPITYVPNGPWVNNYEAIVGDRSKAIIGIRQDITFKLFTEGVISDDSGNVVLNLMQQDAAAMRVVARFGFAVAAPINLENSNDATRFPFAVVINAGS
jgi:HK97 family phage major capsid protein